MTIEKVTPLAVKISLFTIYFVDGLTKYLQHYSSYEFSILPNRALKALMVLMSVICALLAFGKIRKVVYRVYISLFVLVIISLFNNFMYDIGFKYVLKYSCFFFFAPMFFMKVEDKSWIKSVSNTLKCIVYINLFFILCGLVTDLQFYQTYYGRFGYNGLLLTAMQSTYFYISAIFIAIKAKDKLFLVVSIISSLLVGTKILLGFLVLIGFYLALVKIKNTKLRISVLIALLSVFIIIFFVFFNQKIFQDIIINKGVLTAVFSHRNNLLISTWNNLSDINFNIISGGINLENYRVEMGIIDVLMYFGVLGLIVFFVFFGFLKNSFVKSNLSLFYFVVVLVFLVVGGNFLYYPINCFIFLVTLKLLSIKEENRGFMNQSNI